MAVRGLTSPAPHHKKVPFGGCVSVFPSICPSADTGVTPDRCRGTRLTGSCRGTQALRVPSSYTMVLLSPPMSTYWRKEKSSSLKQSDEGAEKQQPELGLHLLWGGGSL